MASVPDGDPGLSQDATDAALDWQQRPKRMAQFTSADNPTGAIAPQPDQQPVAPQATTTKLGQLYADSSVAPDPNYGKTTDATSASDPGRYSNFLNAGNYGLS